MAEITSLRISNPPNKVSYKAGDRFERYGMEVKALYSDQSEATVPFYDVSPSRELRASDTSIRVSFMGFSATQGIDVADVGDVGYFPDVCLTGAELAGNPCINAGDASVRYRCRPIKVGRGAYEVSLTLMYCSRMTDRESGLIQGLPKGWRTDFHRLLVQDGQDGSGNPIYRYIDGDGYIHAFRFNPELGCHLDGDGCGLELDALSKVITDRDGNSMSFDAQGRVFSISETNGKTTVVEYNENGLRKVYDSRKPQDYIKLSYDAASTLRWIRVYKNDTERKIYDIIGMPGQITSIRESGNGFSRELHMFSVNDRDRVNRMVDRLSSAAYRVTYDFDENLNDYIFSSVRKGHMEGGSFVENENGAMIRNSRKMEGANPNLITELRIGIRDNLELQYGVDSMGKIALAFESLGSGRELRSLAPVMGDPVTHVGSFRIMVNGSTSDSFTGTLHVNSGLPSDAFGGAAKLRLCGYVRLRAECSMARISFSHLGSVSRKIEVNPHAREAWQYFQIPFDRVCGADGDPLAFDSFEFYAEDQDGNPMLLAAADLRFMKPDDYPDAVFETADGALRMEDLSSIELTSSEGEAYEIDVSGSEYSFGAGELIMALRRKAAFGDSPRRVYLNGGEITTATYGGLTLVFSGGERVDVFDPSQSDNSRIGNGRNWYLSEGDALDNRAYFHFAEGSWSATYATSRPFVGHPGRERLISGRVCDYCDRVLEERNADGGGFRYEYFPDGDLMRKVAVSDGGEEITVYQESREGDAGHVLEDGIASSFRYENDLLAELELPGSSGQAKAFIAYDAYKEEASSISFFDGPVQVSQNTVSGDDLGLNVTMSDGFSSYKFEKSADDSGEKAFVLDDGYYFETFERIKQGSFSTNVFYVDFLDREAKRITTAVDPYGKIHSVYDDYVLKAALSYESSGQSQSVDKLIHASDSFSGKDTSIAYYPKGDVRTFSSGGLDVEYGDEPGMELAMMSFPSAGSCTFESNGEASQISFGAETAFYSEIERDGFGRVARRYVNSNCSQVTQNYYYEDGSFSRPSGFGFGNSFGESYSACQTNGKLSSKSSYFPMLMVSRAYYYDAFGRLIRETSSMTGLDRSYSYSGGRMSRFGANEISYDSRGRISSFGDTVFEYDNFGNTVLKSGPGGTYSYFYERGNMLSSIQNVASYEYDYEGKRTRKSLRNGDVHEYYYEGGRLVGEDIINVSVQSENRRIRYFYDGQGIVGFSVFDTVGSETRQDFTYIKNPFNEIVGIALGDEVVAIYDYDAWGGHRVLNPNGSENVDPGFVGNLNPIRYKGYYYDVETGLYWLSSRYYDPEIGRFISPDSVDYLDPTSINGLDLYAYCNNDPVNYCDPSGHFAILIGLLIGAALLFTPIGGTIAQAVTSVGCYVGIAVSSIWDENVRNDMDAIGWNPFNSNESSVLNASTVSFYKGVPVFKTKGNRSGSFGAIFLADWSREDDLRHERGHNWQLMMMGIGTYAFTVGIPSPLMLGGWNDNKNYYGAPWETIADILGGVKGRTHSDSEIRNAWLYYGLGHFIIPSIFFWF